MTGAPPEDTQIDFALPPGFLPVDLRADPDRFAALAEFSVAALPGDYHPAVRDAIATSLMLLDELRNHNAVYLSIGVHPLENDPDDGFTRAVFTITVSDTDILDRNLALHSMRSILDQQSGDDIADVELPSGPAILMDGERSYPGLPSRLPNADPPDRVVIRQTRLIIPFPNGDPRVAIAELATPDVEFGDVYHDLLLYIGLSVAFTEPTAPALPRPSSGGPDLIRAILG